MANIQYNYPISNKYFPGYKVTSSPVAIIMVHYNNYEVEQVDIGLPSQILAKMSNHKAFAKEVEEYAASRVLGLKPYPPDETEDFENGFHDEILKDMHSVAEASYNRE